MNTISPQKDFLTSFFDFHSLVWKYITAAFFNFELLSGNFRTDVPLMLNGKFSSVNCLFLSDLAKCSMHLEAFSWLFSNISIVQRNLDGFFKINLFCWIYVNPYPANIFLFKVNNGNTRKMCEEIYWKLIKTPEGCQWLRSGVFIVSSEHISYLFLMFLLLTLNK